MPSPSSLTCDDKPVHGKTRLDIYTDGSSLGNPGPSGWAFVAVAIDEAGRVIDRQERFMPGRSVSTNNRAEMAAALNAMQFARDYRTPSGQTVQSVTIATDSQYVAKAFPEWLPKWIARGWQKSNGDAVENRDLWERMIAAADGLELTWCKIKGHSGHPENERADVLAKAAAERAAEQLTCRR
ncbi:ribonuclease H [Paracoccus sp. SY]|uniref:ribonuclease H family protein n=1 Tax=Paracoccus sp. SY TaxID=1330255 RepID=UPI001304A44F|nr:ribonuclease H [Paracoccus sp. SY]